MEKGPGGNRSTSPAAYPTREPGNGLAGWPSWRYPAGLMDGVYSKEIGPNQ